MKGSKLWEYYSEQFNVLHCICCMRVCSEIKVQAYFLSALSTRRMFPKFGQDPFVGPSTGTFSFENSTPSTMKPTLYVFPSPAGHQDKQLAVLDGPSTLRVFTEPAERYKDEDLERTEWFEEFAWRETRRKLDFRRWQDEYLRQHPTALRRRAEREQAETSRRHQEARERFLRVRGWLVSFHQTNHLTF